MQKAGKITTERVGCLAREALDLLRKEGPLNLAALVREIKGATALEVYMAAGWLACEGRVKFTQLETGLTVMTTEAFVRVVKDRSPLGAKKGENRHKTTR